MYLLVLNSACSMFKSNSHHSFWVRQKRDECSMSVLQVAPKQVRTQLHNVLQIWSAQLPPEPSTGLPHWELHPSSRLLLCQGGSRARASNNATKAFKSLFLHSLFIWFLYILDCFPESLQSCFWQLLLVF